MPFTRSGQNRIFWRVDGHADRPAIVLLHALGTDHALWTPLIPALTRRYRVLRIDLRGHGASDAPGADYTVALLAVDVLACLDAAGIAKAAVCGISLGGVVAQALALRSPGRLWAMALVNTADRLENVSWGRRADLVREKGVAPVVDQTIRFSLGEAFRAAHPAAVDTVRETLLATDPQGYAGCCAANRDLDLAGRMGSVDLPMLVLVGANDEAISPDHGRAIHDAAPHSTWRELPGGHLLPLEAPDALAQALLSFLPPHEPIGSALDEARRTLFENGLQQRKAVLGEDWVHRGLLSRNAFNGEFQAFITRFAWGEIWSRPGLDHKTRRFLVLAITIALGRWEEFRLHVRAGLDQGGFTEEELLEVIMQSGVYAGVPAANTGFHHADEVIRSLGRR